MRKTLIVVVVLAISVLCFSVWPSETVANASEKLGTTTLTEAERDLCWIMSREDHCEDPFTTIIDARFVAEQNPFFEGQVVSGTVGSTFWNDGAIIIYPSSGPTTKLVYNSGAWTAHLDDEGEVEMVVRFIF